MSKARRHSWKFTANPRVDTCRLCALLKKVSSHTSLTEYSADGGSTWQRGATPPCNGSAK